MQDGEVAVVRRDRVFREQRVGKYFFCFFKNEGSSACVIKRERERERE